MLKTFFIFLRFYLFWIAFFFLDRALFLIYFAGKLKGAPAADIARTFIYGLWMDASAAAYVCAAPLVIALIGWIAPSLRLSRKWAKNYVFTILVVFGILTIANFNIYREWGTRINFKALDFLFTAPTEAFASSASSPILGSFLIFFVFISFCYYLSKKIIIYQTPERPPLVAGLIASVFLLLLNFLLIRGGWQLSPMNESMVYFSDRTILNHSAINTEWGLIRDIIKNKYSSKNPYTYYTPKQAETIVSNLYRKPGGNVSRITDRDKPNVILVIMESYTASLMESLGGERGISPNLEQLSKEGMLFTQTYASGDRTDKGLIAVLSGFPSQAIRSIIGFNSKQEKLPSLFRETAQHGYHTSFYYGGETEFFNVKSYMLSHGCQRIIDIGDFKKSDMNSKWGAYDEFVYNRQIRDLSKEKQPFFSTLLTLTNHEPFELPVKGKFPGSDLPQKFRSTAFYADSCIGAFMATARQQPWYNNTLIIFVADHGHHLPQERYEIYDPHRFHIPLLICGGALKKEFRGKQIDKITSQTDIPAIVLTQLGIPSSRFRWSRNVLNPNAEPFAFYDWDNGFGFMTPEQTISFDNVGRHISFRKNGEMPAADLRLTALGKACMQEAFRQYLEY
jgi:phosphoglycerol transferase MdoB-like AlkP superfamily enzyme